VKQPMLKRWWSAVRSPHGLSFAVQVCLVGASVILLAAAVAAVAVPVRIDSRDARIAVPTELPNSPAPTAGSEGDSEAHRRLAKVMRQGLFQPAVPQQDKPMADQTIARIRSSLKLQSIIQIAGQPVAYVNVKDLGLKRCRVGECVSDLFTVLSIGDRFVEISILGHRTVLEL
jgi:hypothetical protein